MKQTVGKTYANKQDYGKLIVEMIHKMDDSDSEFLLKVYTIVHKHINKRGR